VINGKKLVLVMPAYSVERTLPCAFDETPHDIVDDVITIDEASKNQTVDVASNAGVYVIAHESDRGYVGSNLADR
jgi:hypothetical protein